MIPPSFIQDLLARSDIVDIVGRHVTLKKAGINHKGLCPFHGEKSPSFIVSPSRQTYHCFGCGVHGNAIGFLMEHAGQSFVDAVKELAQMQGMPVPEERVSEQEQEQARQQKQQQQSLTDVMAKATQHWRAQLKASPRAIAYLKGRGLTGEIAARFAMGYAPDAWKGLASAFPRYDDPLLVESGLVIVPEEAASSGEQRRYDRFRDRIMFPIRSVRGDIIGFGGRVLDKGEPKYLNSPETPVFSKGRELYGLFEARAALRNKGYVLVTEGYMDVVALAQWGYGNAVATLGTACTADHVLKLMRFTDRVVFSFDGDAAGRRAAGRALQACLPHATDTRRISFLFLPAEHDPDSFIRENGPEAFEERVLKAVPLSRQLLTQAAEGLETDSAEGRAHLLAQALPMLAQLPEGLLRDQIAQDLAEQVRAPLDDVRRRLSALLAPPTQAAHTGVAAGSPAGGPQGAPRARRTAHSGDGHTGSPWDGHDGPSGPWPPDDLGTHGPTGASAGPPTYPEEPWQGMSGARPGSGSGAGAAQRAPWSGPANGSGKRWKRDGQGWARRGPVDNRPLPQAARPLERAAWLLLNHSHLWDGLPPDLHDLLCEQPQPLGTFFSTLDRLTASQGPLQASALLASLTESAAHDLEGYAGAREALAGLLQRLAGFHEMEEAQLTAGDLLPLIRPVQLQAMNDELELLLQSGELSPAAEARKLDLLRKCNALKLEISRQRPTSV